MHRDLKRQKNRPPVSLIAGVVASLIVFAVFLFSIVPKYPSPSYVVNSYEDLIYDFRKYNEVLFPKPESLDKYSCSYIVYLKSRFQYVKEGYTIWCKPQQYDSDEKGFFISCYCLASRSDAGTLNTKMNYNTIALEIGASAQEGVRFDSAGYRYTIRANVGSDTSIEFLIALAETMIDEKYR